MLWLNRNVFFFHFNFFKKKQLPKYVYVKCDTLSRCGSVVLDFMMRFNQSVIVSNVLTFLSDAARQDKFGAFKVDPDSIKQVLPTDGLESTTQGKYFKRG